MEDLKNVKSCIESTIKVAKSMKRLSNRLETMDQDVLKVLDDYVVELDKLMQASSKISNEEVPQELLRDLSEGKTAEECNEKVVNEIENLNLDLIAKNTSLQTLLDGIVSNLQELDQINEN